MHLTHRLLSALLPAALLLLPSCGGGGGGTGNSSANDQGSVHVVLDTATGSEALVQYQVAAAQLERADGSRTGNLLAAPELVTFADPSGEADAVTLRQVPTGDYVRLHLLLAPGSGAALYPDGTVRGLQTAADLAVALPEALAHSSASRSWLSLGHQGSAPPAAGAGSPAWAPELCGRVGGTAQGLFGMRVATVGAADVVGTLPVADDAALGLGFASGCEFFDDGGNPIGRDDFVRGLRRGDDVSVDGDLHRDGRLLARRAHHHGRGNDGPRYLGRIRELRPAAQSFVMDVQAEVRRGGRRLLPTPAQVLVQAQNARIHWSNSPRALTFAQLQAGQLAKVSWSSRTPATATSLEEVVAREIEVTSGPGAPMTPEWQGAVQSVDVPNRTITVVPRGNDPIVIRGQNVTSVQVSVPTGTPIERRERQGPGRSQIGLGDLVPGQDRIWWRGTVTGPAAIDATWVRVRDDS